MPAIEAEVLSTLQSAREDVEGLIEDLDDLKDDVVAMSTELGKRVQAIKGAFDELRTEQSNQRNRTQTAAALVRTQTEEVGALVVSFAQRFQHIQAFNSRVAQLDGEYVASLKAREDVIAALQDIDNQAAAAFTDHTKTISDDVQDVVREGMETFEAAINQAVDAANTAADTAAQEISEQLESNMQSAVAAFDSAAATARGMFEENAKTRNANIEETIAARLEEMKADKATRTEQLIGKVGDIRKLMADVSKKLDQSTTTMAEGMDAATEMASAAGTGLELAASIFTNIQDIYTEIEEIWQS